jgi:choline-glycine betaine transporter
MFNLISFLIGLVAIVPLLLTLLPYLWWINWLLLPVPIVGLIIGLISRGSAGRNLNLIVLIIAILRLTIWH